MVNEVSKKIKALIESHKVVSKKVKVLAESNKAMNEKLSRLQEVLENMTEEKLQSLDSIDQESTIHEPIAISVEQEHTTDQESTIHEPVVGVNTSDQMVFDVGQTHALKNRLLM